MKHSAHVDSLIAATKVRLIHCRLVTGTCLLFEITPNQALLS